MIGLNLGAFAIMGGLIQSVLLAFFFFRSDRFGGRALLLGWAFLLLSVLFSLGLAFQTGFVLEFPHLSRVGHPLSALAAPLFALALQKYFGYPKERRIWVLFFFSVPALILLYSIPHYAMGWDEKLKYVLEDRVSPHLECVVIGAVTLCFNLAVFLRVYYRLGALGEEFSGPSFQELHVFRRFVSICILLLAVSVCLFFTFPGLRSETVSTAALSIWVIVFAWFRVYSENAAERSEDKEGAKYKKAYLSEESVTNHGKRIFQILNAQKPFLDSDFDLGTLAASLGISIHATSQVIGRYFGKGFLELCREFKVAEAEKLLHTTDLPVLRVGLDAGFNSKTAFLRAFKEEKGMTPSEFREKQKSV
ncbi:AraC family transcriptional regulator [Leptospira yasudae]|uniref:AraC family transcriptional regulator n=1 Tax=Leptospira yasudae TaxID=2202201 RepID=UPI001083BBC4|nr:helix-turn-helix domain-containing protein [Leptospira yasudae]TGK23138.1 AraC family transcriptional regulator [Leptospira yasudae]TGM00392.1 AraC family transcriptional regulator [Leptospira yasudae]